MIDRPPVDCGNDQPIKTHGYTAPSESPNGSFSQVEERVASKHAEISAGAPSQAFIVLKIFKII